MSYIQTDEDALICDFAETYQIYDWRSLPGRYAATLAAGLRPTARVVMKQADVTAEINSALLARITDQLSGITYMMSRKHAQKPQFIMDQIIHADKAAQAKKTDTYKHFATPEEYEAAWSRIAGGKHHIEGRGTDVS